MNRSYASAATSKVTPGIYPALLRYQAAELVAVGDQVDLDDAAAGDGEADDRERPARQADEEAGAAVDERGPRQPGERASAREHAARDRLGAAHRQDPGPRARVDPEDDV